MLISGNFNTNLMSAPRVSARSLAPPPLLGAQINMASSSFRRTTNHAPHSWMRDLLVGVVLFGVFLGIFTIALNTDYDLLSKRIQAFISPYSFMKNQQIPQVWLVRYNISAIAESDFTTDTDGDGLTLEQEYQYLTNPLVNDTDGDGVLDGKEIKNRTNPLGKGILDMNGDGVVDVKDAP